jgi:hypothetical protein
MRRAALRLVPLALAALAGCVTAPPPGCTALGRDAALCLLPPAALPAVDASHIVTVSHDGGQDSFMGLLHIDASALRLAALSLFGTDLFTIEYDGSAVTSRPEYAGFKPDILVVMLELAIADPTRLQDRLHNLRLTIGAGDHLQRRDLYEGERLVAHIETTEGPLAAAHIHIDIPPLKLSVDMTPIPATAGAP